MRRRILDAILYLVRTGRAWRQLPKDFAPCPTSRGVGGRAHVLVDHRPSPPGHSETMIRGRWSESCSATHPGPTSDTA
ncbi:transposase [Streptomyces sp. NPDC091371]|uniref:transposase n=1 Tax=Streptomyces sp. NPDC091371 TaxID=3155303 RepID=UPI00341A6402